MVEPHKRLLLADAGAISINKIVSAEGDEQPDRAPEVRVSTDITRCGKTVMALVGIVVVFDTVLVRCDGYPCGRTAEIGSRKSHPFRRGAALPGQRDEVEEKRRGPQGV